MSVTAKAERGEGSETAAHRAVPYLLILVLSITALWSIWTVGRALFVLYMAHLLQEWGGFGIGAAKSTLVELLSTILVCAPCAPALLRSTRRGALGPWLGGSVGIALGARLLERGYAQIFLNFQDPPSRFHLSLLPINYFTPSELAIDAGCGMLIGLVAGWGCWRAMRRHRS